MPARCCTRSARRTRLSIRRRRNIAPPSSWRARMSPIRLRALQADADALKAERRGGARGQDHLRACAAPAAARHDQLGGGAERGAVLPAGAAGAGAGAGQSLCRYGRAVPGARRRMVESSRRRRQMNDLVRREDRGGAATLMLNRPEKLNALTKEVFEALDEHVDAIARETRTIGLVILRGAGGNFSAGYDMTGGARARQGACQAALSLRGHPENREPAAAGDLRGAGALLHRCLGTGVGGGSDRGRPSRRSSRTSMHAGA